MKPRDYQEAAFNALWAYLCSEKAKNGHPLLVLPTGTGKSLLIAMIIMRLLQQYPNLRIVVAAHVKELVDNNFKTLMKVWPGAPAGIYSAGLNRKDTNAQITFAGIGSVAKRGTLFKNADLVLIDEAHRVSDDASSDYLKFFSAIKAHNPNVKLIGLTATDFRLGMGKLTEGKTFTDVAFDLSSGPAFVWLVEQGYLSPLIPKKPHNEISVEGVAIRKGEFATKQMEDAIREQGIIDKALDEAIELAADRDHWLVFATSIEQIEEISEKLNLRGVRASFVHSKISDKERDKRIADFTAGKYRALVNQDILTTGFDFPNIDCLVILRPTMSPGLWVQILGRGTRPVFARGHNGGPPLYDLNTAEGRLAAIAAGPKQNCLVLDFAGNTMRLGPINYPSIPRPKGKGGGGPPMRMCPNPQCRTMVHISVRVCPDCGQPIYFEEKLTSNASEQSLIFAKPAENPAKVFKVDRMLATRHQKEGKPDSVKVDYYCGVRRFTTWVTPEHVGAERMTRIWWNRHAPIKGLQPPVTTAGLLAAFDTLRKPTHIKVMQEGKYMRVIDYDFTGAAFEPVLGPVS